MRNLKYIRAAAAMGGLITLPQTGSASPLATGVASGTLIQPELTEGLVQKVHGWHCRKRYGWYHHHKYWHRHYRACRRYHRSYNDDYYDDDYKDYYDDYSPYHHKRRHPYADYDYYGDDGY